MRPNISSKFEVTVTSSSRFIWQPCAGLVHIIYCVVFPVRQLVVNIRICHESCSRIRFV